MARKKYTGTPPPPELARILGCSERRVYTDLQSGRLPENYSPQDAEALYGQVIPQSDPIKETALRIVAEAPRLTGQQLEQIAALLRGNAKAVA
jgi:hypothetical protein